MKLGFAEPTCYASHRLPAFVDTLADNKFTFVDVRFTFVWVKSAFACTLADVR